MRYVIAYDIVDDRRRQRLARFLLDWGDRVQYSVFECDLTLQELGRVAQEVVRYIEPKEDRVRIYRLCAECAGLVRTMGRQRPTGTPAVVVI